MKGVLGLLPVLLSPAGRSRVPLARRFNPASRIREDRDLGQQIGRISDSDSGVPASDDGNVRGRRDSVKAPQGPRKSTGSPHPRREKGAGLRGAPEHERLKLTTANSFVDPSLLRPREWPGLQEGTQFTNVTMAQPGDGPLTQCPTGRTENPQWSAKTLPHGKRTASEAGKAQTENRVSMRGFEL